MSLSDRRSAIRHLIDPRQEADARAAYYAFDHPENRTTLVTYLPNTARARGYVCLSRTGLDLFRPLVTMRLPLTDMNASAELLYSAIPVGAPIMMSVPASHLPIVKGLFAISSETNTTVFALDRGRYAPVINVLVTSETGPNGLIRYVIRRDGETVASASINWQSRYFAEVGVETRADQRRQGWGRSVVAALCQHLLDQGIRPLYVSAAENRSSIQLAESVGFINTGNRLAFLEASLNPRA